MTGGIDRDALAGPTLRGIDLVAIERVRNGQPADLTDAELEYLMATYDGTTEQGDLIARGLGIDRGSVNRRISRAPKAAGTRHGAAP